MRLKLKTALRTNLRSFLCYDHLWRHQVRGPLVAVSTVTTPPVPRTWHPPKPLSLLRKDLRLVLTFGISLSLLLSIGMVQVASANKMHIEFACEDGSTGFNIKAGKDSKGHPQVAVTCKSNARVEYINYNGDPPSAVDVTCPGTENVGSGVDVANEPTSKYIFYCVKTGGTVSDPKPKRTNSKPTVKIGTATNGKCADGSTPPGNDVSNCPVTTQNNDKAISGGACPEISNNHCDLLDKYVNPLINFLAALVGVAVVISIVIGGIQYGSSAGDPQAVTAAKNRIRNAIIALITFIFLYAMLNFLIPGGLL